MLVIASDRSYHPSSNNIPFVDLSIRHALHKENCSTELEHHAAHQTTVSHHVQQRRRSKAHRRWGQATVFLSDNRNAYMKKKKK